MKLLFLMGFGPSMADDVESMRSPTQCDAVFVASEKKSCKMSGNWATTSTARTGEKAKEQALLKLQSVVHLEVQVRLGKASPIGQDLLRPVLAGCASDALEQAKVYCHEDQSLSAKGYCYASFEDSSCWDGMGLEIVDKRAWKSMELGRAEICASMDQWMAKQNTDQVTRDRCQASCLQSAKVTCRAN